MSGILHYATTLICEVLLLDLNLIYIFHSTRFQECKYFVTMLQGGYKLSH